jgi:uncharacterized protein (TIGR03089 family)
MQHNSQSDVHRGQPNGPLGPGIRSIADLLDVRFSGGEDRPFLTFYDDGRGDRVELSYKTFANWVGKVANLLAEEYGVGAGDRVATVAGVHWQATAIHFACWQVGATAVVAVPPDGEDVPADATGESVASVSAAGPAVVLAREEWLDAVRAAVRAPLVALCADPFGRPSRDLGTTPNFSRIVPAMPDEFDGEAGGRDDGALLLDPAGPALRQGELLAQAAAVARRWRLGAVDRVLSSLPDHRPGGLAAGLLAPFAVGGGTVRNREFSAGAFWQRVAGEHVTVASVTAAEAAALLEREPGEPGERSRPERLRLVVCRDDAPPELAAAWQERFGMPLTPAASPELAAEPAASGEQEPGREQEPGPPR